MKRKVIKLLNSLSILIIIICLSACANGKGGELERISFFYQQGTTTDYESYMYYDDDYFNGDSTEYNPSLATCSLCLAMSSFASNRNQNYKDYSFRYRNVYNLMEQIGFNNIEVNDWYKTKPTTDSIGLIFGNKQLFGKTFIVVGIRGANYESEWASNCTIGNSGLKEHQGFYDSATIYLNDLKSYIEKNKITGDIILWSVGYSRASAVNNMACARIDRAIYNNEKILGNNVNIKKEDLYAYCFEVPMGASFDEEISPRSEIYNNIFNIVNPSDIVTMVAPSYLGFTRYGVDHYLPASNLEESYKSQLEKILSFYTNMQNYDVLGEYKISEFKMYSLPNTIGAGLITEDTKKVNWTLSLYLNEFVDSLSEYGIKNIDNFCENIQNGLRYSFSILYGKTPPRYSLETVLISLVRNVVLNGDIDYLIAEILHNPSEFANDIIPYIIDAITYLGEDIDAKELSKGLVGLLTAIANTFKKNIGLVFPLINTNNINAIASAHYPELCLAHMMAQDPKYTSKPISYNNTGSYYKVIVPYSNDLTLTIKDNDSVLVKVNDGKLENVSYLAYGINKNNFVAYLPVGKSYIVEGTNDNLLVYKFVQTDRDLLTIKPTFINNVYHF